MKIYIAGPMTGYENYNRPMFNAVAQQMLSGGHVALNPATLPDGLSQREYMDICLAPSLSMPWLKSWELKFLTNLKELPHETNIRRT